MAEMIDYFYSHVSPFAYFGHTAFLEMAERNSVEIRFRPVNLGLVFPETGGLMLGQRHPKRQEYRWYELQRCAEKRAIAINFKPAHFPTSPALADSVAIALASIGNSPAKFSLRMFASCWSNEQDIADEAVVRAALAGLGEDVDKVLAEARSDNVQAVYAQNAQDAIAIPAFGSPCFVRGGEPFWGQDRIDFLEDAIVSGRAPFRPL